MATNPGGRPSTLTAAIQRKICTIIRQGNFREVASRAAGVSPRTVSYWCKRGREEPDGPCGDFLRAILKAEQDAETRAVAAILKAGKKDVDHLKWWLARRHCVRWGDVRRELKEIQKEQKETRKLLDELRHHSPPPPPPAHSPAGVADQ